MDIAGIEVREREEDYININPLQTAGRPYADARKAVISYVDGYSVCDWCKGDLRGRLGGSGFRRRTGLEAGESLGRRSR